MWVWSMDDSVQLELNLTRLISRLSIPRIMALVPFPDARGPGRCIGNCLSLGIAAGLGGHLDTRMNIQGTLLAFFFWLFRGLKCRMNVHVPQYIHEFRSHRWSSLGIY